MVYYRPEDNTGKLVLKELRERGISPGSFPASLALVSIFKWDSDKLELCCEGMILKLS